ncbi:GNAT family N-acetyltransferase [Clostridium sp. SYSU_GA19001]|uniref:GNAT family N-acetyltransferase n=1 Tax=Clostridium caldaquaticum TaxID=2940653 RepID=UPI0020771FBD|nr:GNAT family protein [Clostridium caldaquaticum]MCM8711961.1 GNAT family N-acetyltransferase [Clostridium caldaquaticum]
MEKTQNVSISPVKGNDREYIIKDYTGITMGRFFIIELSRENRFCSIRVKFYRNEGEDYRFLKEAVKLILISLFKNMNIFKVNVLIDEDINIRAFTELGFQFEGVISNSIIVNNTHKQEFIFGIDKDIYQNSDKNRSLILKGQNIELRLLTPENANDILEYYKRNREYLKPFEPARDESFYTLELQKRDIIENYKQFLNGTSVNLGIFKNDKFIGKIRVSNIVMGIFKNAFVGYSIDKNEQGKGYMKEALRLTIKYAFEELGLHRIEATTLVDNIKSQAVLLGCGFKEIGVSEKYLFINGEWRDHKIFYRINMND